MSYFLLFSCGLLGVLATMPLHVFPGTWPMDWLMNALHPAGGFLLAATIVMLFEQARSRHLTPYLGVLAALAVAAALELVQSYVGRTSSWTDLAGSSLGIVVWLVVRRLWFKKRGASAACR